MHGADTLIVTGDMSAEDEVVPAPESTIAFKPLSGNWTWPQALEADRREKEEQCAFELEFGWMREADRYLLGHGPYTVPRNKVDRRRTQTTTDPQLPANVHDFPIPRDHVGTVRGAFETKPAGPVTRESPVWFLQRRPGQDLTVPPKLCPRLLHFLNSPESVTVQSMCSLRYTSLQELPSFISGGRLLP
jgi:hypothetical protein